MEWTCNSHIVIVSLCSAILTVCSMSVLLVFSLLRSALLALLLLTWRVLILGKDDESPRKSGVAGAVRSGAGSTVFNVDATSWNGRICITAPVEQTTIRLAADDAHDAGHSPGAFPFVSATFVPFLLPIHPNDLSHFALAFVHSLHIHPGIQMQHQLFFLYKAHSTMCGTDPDSSCVGGPSPISMSSLLLATNWWEHWAYGFISLDNDMVIWYLPYAASPTYVHLVHAPMGGPSPSPCPSLFCLLAVQSVWMTWMRLLCVPPLLTKLLLPAVFLPCIARLLPPSIVNRSHWPFASSSWRGCWWLPPCRAPSPSWGMPWNRHAFSVYCFSHSLEGLRHSCLQGIRFGRMSEVKDGLERHVAKDGWEMLQVKMLRW